MTDDQPNSNSLDDIHASWTNTRMSIIDDVHDLVKPFLPNMIPLIEEVDEASRPSTTVEDNERYGHDSKMIDKSPVPSKVTTKSASWQTPNSKSARKMEINMSSNRSVRSNVSALSFTSSAPSLIGTKIVTAKAKVVAANAKASVARR